MDFSVLTDEINGLIVSPDLIASILIIIAAIAALFGMRTMSRRYREKIKASDLNGTRRDKIVRSFQVIVRYGIIVGAVIAIMQVNGIDISALAAALGIVGIIVAFSLQDALADLAMGARIVMDNYFSLGDIVRVDDFEGEVVAFSPQSTKINNTADDSILTISNRNMDKVITISKINIIIVPLSSSYSTEQTKAFFKKVCDRLVGEDEKIDDARYVGVDAYTEYWVEHRLLVWCSPKTRFQTQRDARLAIMEELERSDMQLASAEMRIVNA